MPGKAKYFNHSHIRTLIGVFGKVFSRLYTARFSDDGSEIEALRLVPTAYLPFSKEFLPQEEIARNESLKNRIRIYEHFPRITYDFKGLSYQPGKQRALNRQYQNQRNVNQFGFMPAPYDLSFELNIVARDQFTATQIVEQILPYFRPHLTVAIRHEVFDENEKDVVINLEDITLEDNYDELDARRIIRYILTFTVETDFWPRVQNSDLELIKFLQENNRIEVPPDLIPPDDPDDSDEDVTNPGDTQNTVGIIEKIIIDQHDYNVFQSDDLFWPVQERCVIEPNPNTATNLSEVESLDTSLSFPDDESQRIPLVDGEA